MKLCREIVLYASCSYIAVLLVQWIFNGFVFQCAFFREALPRALGIALGLLCVEWFKRRKERKS